MRVLNKENLNELVNSGFHLVDFYAEWCGPCKMLGPVLESISSEIDIIKVNIDTHEDLTLNYRIMSVPTILFFKDGEVIHQISGFHSKEELLTLIHNFKKA